MRVISQDGSYDIPYEHSSLYMFCNNCGIGIGAEINSCSPRVIAEYSTEEKAIKAMEMLRETYDKGIYVGYPKIDESNVAEDDSMTLFRVESAKFYPDGYYKNCKVFQFPQDDEIEV